MIQSELIDKIASDIRNIKNVNDLNFLASELKEQRKYLGRKIGNTLQKGDKVIVSNGSSKDEGVITKVNKTRAVVDMRDGSWTVPFSMITKQGME